MTNQDPMQEAASRIKAAGDQLGAAMADAVRLAFRRAVANQLADEIGPGPWTMYPDGRVERQLGGTERLDADDTPPDPAE